MCLASEIINFLSASYMRVNYEVETLKWTLFNDQNVKTSGKCFTVFTIQMFYHLSAGSGIITGAWWCLPKQHVSEFRWDRLQYEAIDGWIST